MRLFRSRVYFKVTIAGFGDAVADAGILDGTGDARPGVAAEGVAYREQGFAQGRAFAEHLPGGDHAARGHGVVIAELPAVRAPFSHSSSMRHSIAKFDWLTPNPGTRPPEGYS